MRDRSIPSSILLPAGMMLFLALMFLAMHSPGLFANTSLLGAILILQVALFALSHFQNVFFPLLMGTFVLAGSSLPLSGTATSLRWFFLAIGALGGFVIWVKSPRPKHFAIFHLVALLCVLAALVSASVSEVPTIALLKVLSLFMLFLYTSSGSRAAILGRESVFVSRLVLACEILVYISSVCYLVLGFSVFGNPNALGAVITVGAVPVLLWAASVADTRQLRQRRFFALALCGGLLYLSNSRASILASTVVFVVFTVALRHQRLLLQVALVSVFFVTAMAVINPTRMDEMVSTLTVRILYKDQVSVARGVFGSRQSPWHETLSVVKRHPWFGSGFGTSELGEERPNGDSSTVYTSEGTNREHGNSYLALAEYMGVIGGLPFLVLLLMLTGAVIRIVVWMRRTGNVRQYCIPFALVAIAGLVHACFEDWLFAPGSYLCVFFWVAAFVLMDLVPETLPARSKVVLRSRGGLLPSAIPVAQAQR